MFFRHYQYPATIFLAWAAYVFARALNLVQIELPFHLSNAHCLEFLFGVAVGAAAILST